MRKKFFASLGIAAFAAVVAFNINAKLRTHVSSDLSLANIEALAGGESSNCNQGARTWEEESFWHNDYWFFTCDNCTQVFGRVRSYCGN